MYEDLKEFISSHFLKSGEQLGISDFEGYWEKVKPDLIEFKIMKSTARTLRMTGKIIVNPNSHSDKEGKNEENPDLELLNWTLYKRANLTDESKIFTWLHQGWIYKEIRFKSDEKTVERIQYRMGYRLFLYQRDQTQQQEESHYNELKSYQEQAKSLLEQQVETKRLHLLIQHILISMNWKLSDINDSSLFPNNWSFDKRIKFMYFLIAIVSISSRKEMFDWKEIGAQYVKEIGGSKVFDTLKDPLIELLEEWGMQPLSAYGLVSLGKITPLYFAGNLAGRWSNYRAGPVHSLTDLSIAKDFYQTEADTLWLVENRGVLTRIAAEEKFIQTTNSLVVCMDGQLRSSHRIFIQNLLRGSKISQVILWTDYDSAGLLISSKLLNAVTASNLKQQEEKIMIKWVRHDHELETSWTSYQSYMNSLLLTTEVEQEEVLGGKEEWIRWINL